MSLRGVAISTTIHTGARRVRHTWPTCLLVSVLAAYSVFWAGLVVLAWFGAAPATLFQLDTIGSLSYLAVWTRLMLILWAVAMVVGAVSAWRQQPLAAVWLAAGFVPHLLVFLSLSSHPYYDGRPGYVNFALEIVAIYLLYRGRRQGELQDSGI